MAFLNDNMAEESLLQGFTVIQKKLHTLLRQDTSEAGMPRYTILHHFSSSEVKEVK